MYQDSEIEKGDERNTEFSTKARGSKPKTLADYIEEEEKKTVVGVTPPHSQVGFVKLQELDLRVTELYRGEYDNIYINHYSFPYYYHPQKFLIMLLKILVDHSSLQYHRHPK